MGRCRGTSRKADGRGSAVGAYVKVSTCSCARADSPAIDCSIDSAPPHSADSPVTGGTFLQFHTSCMNIPAISSKMLVERRHEPNNKEEPHAPDIRKAILT